MGISCFFISGQLVNLFKDKVEIRKIAIHFNMEILRISAKLKK